MSLPLFQIDAFTDEVFGGNPACVVPLSEWLADEVLLKIARENAVPETAFFVDLGDRVHLRWFTPDIEMDLCGHATLAAAHCLAKHLDYPHQKIHFTTASGDLTVHVRDAEYELNLPARMPTSAEIPSAIAKALNIAPAEVLKARDYVLMYPREEDVRNIEIDRKWFDQINLGHGGVIVTAPGVDCDFVSRYFTPQATILEDPVTGSAHCSLIPLWADRLGKSEMLARQLSQRGGRLRCTDDGDRVLVSGCAQTYAVGQLSLSANAF